MILLTESKTVEIVVCDEAGHGGAHHKYRLIKNDTESIIKELILEVNFQNGPVKEHGLNGVFIEDLLEICKHRLECFQNGKFACDANKVALGAVKYALDALYGRTAERCARGVEGTSQM